MARYCGLQKADELAGRRVKLTQECRNGNGSMPAGTSGVVDENQFIRNGKLSFTADKCDCCGFQWRVSGLCYDDLELVEKTSPEHSEERSKWESEPDARKRLEVKLRAVKSSFDDFSEDEYGQWIDALEFDEFLELVALCDETERKLK